MNADFKVNVYLQEHRRDTVTDRDSASAVASDGHICQCSASLHTNLNMEKVKVVIEIKYHMSKYKTV